MIKKIYKAVILIITETIETVNAIKDIDKAIADRMWV